MVRLVYREGRGVLVDVQQKMSGRGAYICRDETCFRKGLQVKALSTAFRRKVVIDGDLLGSISLGGTEGGEGITSSPASTGGGA
jgi:predicted RNA-binding protein YlxR (DUF448 family)